MSISSTLSRGERTVAKTQPINVVNKSTHSTAMLQSKKSLYQVAQQVKFLHLQAEVESLLQQLQFLKQQRLTAASYNAADNRQS